MTLRERERRALPAIVLTAAALAGAGPGSAAQAADAPAAHYTLDPAKSTLDYQFEQAGAQNKGKFVRFTVTLDLSPDNLAATKLDVVVDMASTDTGDKER